MTRLLQIYEDDLAELEKYLPILLDALAMQPGVNNWTRTKIRRVKNILTNVRWNYGPPRDVEKIEP